MDARTAYVSMICGGDAYVPGLETLGRSLLETGTRIPRVALVTRDVSPGARAKLGAQGWRLREVEPIGNPRGDVLLPRFAELTLHAFRFAAQIVQRFIGPVEIRLPLGKLLARGVAFAGHGLQFIP